MRATGIDESWLEICAEGIVLLMFIIRMFNLDIFVKFSTALAIVSIIPAIIYVGYAFKYVDPSPWTNTNGDYPCSNSSSRAVFTEHLGDVSYSDSKDDSTCRLKANWGDLLPYVFWCFGGFLSMGTLAGQVHNPKRTVPMSLIILTPIVLAELLLPLALSLSIDQDLEDYEPGHYAQLAQQIAGTWLNVMITFAAITALIGSCKSMVLVSDEALQSVALEHYPDFFESKAHGSSGLARWFFNTDSRIAPVFAVIDCGVLAVIVWAPYNIIISCGMLLMNLTVLLTFAAYIILKWRHPDAGWLYGKSWVGALFLSFLPAATTIGITYFAMTDDASLYGIPYFKLTSTAVIVALGFLVHAVYAAVSWCRGPVAPSFDELENGIQ